MPIQVPQIPASQHGGSPILSTILQSILWPMRQEASQKAQEKRMGEMSEAERQSTIGATAKTLEPYPELTKTLGLPTTGHELPPDTQGPTMTAQQNLEGVLGEKTYPANMPYGASTRRMENLLAETGLAGGKVKTAESYAGTTPEGVQQTTTMPLGVGAPGPMKAPQLMTGITPEGGQQVIPKVAGATVSTPGGLQANVLAKQAPKLVSEMGPNGEPMQRFETPVPGKTMTANPQNLRFRFREAVPGSGLMVDNMTGHHVIFPDGVTPVVINLNQTQETALKFLAAKPVSNVLAMKQMAPTVQQLISETMPTLEKAKAELGPAGGRLSDLIARKVGMKDPEYMQLATNLELLPTLVGRMHFGSRAPVEVINKFRALVDPGHQSPENIAASIRAWDLYAQGTATLEFGAGGASTEATRAAAAPKAAAPIPPVPGETYEQYKARATAAGAK